MEISKEDKLLLAQIEDKYQASQNRYMMTTSEFLDLRQRSLIEKEYRFNPSLEFYGGFGDCERSIAVFKPEYITESIEEYFKDNEEECPLTWLSIHTAKGSRKLTHRDYLGSLTGLGIRREKVGDILVREDGADIVILKDIADFLKFNYEKAGRTTLKLEITQIGEIALPEQQFKVITDTVASLRLDSVLSSAFGLSRAKAAEAIKRGICFVNSALIEKSDFQVKEGDRMVIRGMGKARLAEVGGKSRKDRIYIKIEKYL